MAQRVRGVDNSGISERLATEATSSLIQTDTGNISDKLTDVNSELDSITANTTPVVVDTYSNGKVSVGSSSTTILSANTDRKRAYLYNDSDEDIYLGLGEAAVMNEGIGLPPTKCFPVPIEFKGAIYGICTSGSKNITYSELSIS